MKISDFVFQYPTTSASGRDGICRVRLFVTRETSSVYALVTEVERNCGDSVTNCIEIIRNGLIRYGLIDAGAVIIEHYEREEWYAHTFDLVCFDEKTQWKKLQAEAVKSLLCCDDAELRDVTAKNARLGTHVEQLRNSIDPFLDFPWQKSRDVILRSVEIQSGMVSKDSLTSLVTRGVTERELQRTIKTDLSLLGEVYGHPHGEYICFAEFPVGEGFVDFAVLTGRSRMDVVLIEVKGADFFLVNGDAYGGFARNINQAADQIRTRLAHAYERLEEFRLDVHKVRETVESGASRYQSFQGPEGKLKVDGLKDINLYGVVIGGRTRNDHEESSKRHQYERFAAPHIRIESWDTWLRKLRRF